MNNIDPLIKERAKPFIKKYNRLIKLINKYDRIAVFRHVKPDYDALGTQLSLATWIKDNFKDKEVVCLGQDHVNLTPRCFPKMDVVDDSWFEKDFLALVVDTSESKRVDDKRYKKAKTIVKIDHHPEVKPYGKTQIVDDSYAAAGELLGNFFIFNEKKYALSKEAAAWLYIAIVGDSGRFLFSSVNSHTFAVAKKLLEAGIEITPLYKAMYQKSIKDLEIKKWVLQNYKVTEKGVAYYIMDNEVLKEFSLAPEEGKDNVNIFANIENIKIWMSITQDIEEHNWRVSIRSGGTVINGVAEKYKGGGHAQASGCKLRSLKELPKLIEDLENLL